MSNKYFHQILFILLALLLNACAARASDTEQASQALTGFFGALSQGQYSDAARLYAGSYETLVGYNPEINPDDHAALWRNGCQVNGLQCLTVRTATFNELNSDGEYLFTIEFNTPDGSLFERGACCGEEPTTSPQFQFEYRVVEGGDGQFRVMDLPVYIP